MPKPQRRAMVVSAVALAVATVPAAAGELCVTCAGPDVTYRCVFGDTVASRPDDPRAQVLCIKELAKFGNHESCAVDLRLPAQCPGMLRAVSPPEVAKELPPLTRPPAGPLGTPMPLPDREKPAATEPRTVEQLAKDTANSTGDELGKAGTAVKDTAKGAGNAIGNAAKKSWHCLVSLFTDC